MVNRSFRAGAFTAVANLPLQAPGSLEPPRARTGLRPRLRRARTLALAVAQKADRDNLGLIAAGVAFFALLALFPALTAVAALYGAMGDLEGVREQITALRGVAPDPVLDIARGQLARLVNKPISLLALSGVLSVAVALWSALQGMRGLIRGLTIVYNHSERRTLVRRYVVSGAFTLAAIGALLVSLLLAAAAPAVIAALQLSSHVEMLLQGVRWVLLTVFSLGLAGALYRWGPNRRPPPFRWIWPGVLVASVTWLAASAGFSLYVRAFAMLGEAYGSLAGVIVLLLWLYLSVLVFLLGGELNAELEREARTTGSEQSR